MTIPKNPIWAFLLLTLLQILCRAYAEEIVWLEPAGAADKSLAVWQADLSGVPKGALILVHGLGDQPKHSKRLIPLQHHLAKWGWASLSISAPKVRYQSDTPLPQAKLQEEALATLAAALAFLNSKGQYNLALLGDGLGNAWIWPFAQQLAGQQASTQTLRSGAQSAAVSRSIRALVMMNAHEARLAEAHIQDMRFSWPEKLVQPILDIYVDDFNRAQDLAETRQSRARQLKLADFRQKRFTASPPLHLPEQNALFKYIRGFLDSKAAGVRMY